MSERILKHIEIDGIHYKLVASEAATAEEANKLSDNGINELFFNTVFKDALECYISNFNQAYLESGSLVASVTRNVIGSIDSFDLKPELWSSDIINDLSARIALRLGLTSTDCNDDSNEID